MAQFIIPTIFTAVDNMSAPIHRMQGSLSALSATTAITARTMRQTMAATSAAAMEVATSAALIGAAILIPLALATKAVVAFEKQMANIASQVDTTKESISVMGDQVLEMAKKIPVATHDLTESLYEIRSSGIGAADAMDVLSESAKLSVAGLSSALEATDAMTSAINVFKSEHLSANQIADLFYKTVQYGKTTMAELSESFGSNAPIVHEAGVTLLEFSAATSALTLSGLKASEAQTAFRGSIMAMIKPTKDMERVLHALGARTGEELIQKMGGSVNALQAVSDQGKKMGINLSDSFGRVQGLTAVTLLTGSINQSFQDILKSMRGANLVNEAYQKQLATSASKMQIARNQVQILGIRIGAVLLPALGAVLSIVTPIIEAVANFAKRHKTLTGIIVGSIAVFGVFAITVGAIALIVGTVTKAYWLWNIATKAVAFTQGALAVATGTLNGELLLQPGAARGAAAAMGILNTSASGLLVTLAAISSALFIIYGIYKALDRRDEVKAKLDAIGPYLPANITREQANQHLMATSRGGNFGWEKTLHDKLYPNQIDTAGNAVDSLVKERYTIPKAREDSISNELQRMQGQLQEKMLRDMQTADSVQNTLGGQGSYSMNESKQTLEVYVRTDPGTTATIGKNTGALPVVMGATGNYLGGNTV